MTWQGLLDELEHYKEHYPDLFAAEAKAGTSHDDCVKLAGVGISGYRADEDDEFTEVLIIDTLIIGDRIC